MSRYPISSPRFAGREVSVVGGCREAGVGGSGLAKFLPVAGVFRGMVEE
jgi:hypothetical protein